MAESHMVETLEKKVRTARRIAANIPKHAEHAAPTTLEHR